MDQDRSSRGYEGQAGQQRHLSNKPASAFYSDKLMGADVRSRQDNEDIGTEQERLNPTGTTQRQHMVQQRSEQDRSDKRDADKRYSDQQRTTGMSQHS